ncbi:hypothetical protein VULLAG_LOCUS23706 [Vulpes lagopus]
MPAAESKPVQMVVTGLIPYSDLEGHLHPWEPSRPYRPHHRLSRSSICLSSWLPDSVGPPALHPSNNLNHLKSCPRPDWGPAAPSRPEVIETCQLLELTDWPAPRCQLLSQSHC